MHYSRAVLEVLRVSDLFDDVFSIEHTRYRPKPDPAGFQRLLRKHRLQARRCVMVEDNLDNLRAAKRLGMKTVWVDRSHGRRPMSTSTSPALRSSRACCATSREPVAAMPTTKPGERKLQILQTLAQMLETPAAERITTAALAAKLDVSEAALYRHFASKAQMFEGLIGFIEETIFGLVNKITAEKPAAWRSSRRSCRCCWDSPRRTAA